MKKSDILNQTMGTFVGLVSLIIFVQSDLRGEVKEVKGEVEEVKGEVGEVKGEVGQLTGEIKGEIEILIANHEGEKHSQTINPTSSLTGFEDTTTTILSSQGDCN